MSENIGSRGQDEFTDIVTVSRTTTLADHWGLVLTLGLLTFGIGLILAVWPGETLTVLAVLLALEFILMGCVRIFLALGSASLDRNGRWIVGLSGAVAVVVGILCLTDPIQTLKVVGILIGIFWILAGLADLVGAFLPSTPDARVWAIVKGVITVAAGVFLVANPKVSLGFIVIVSVVWLLGYGLILIVEALRLRNSRAGVLPHREAQPLT